MRVRPHTQCENNKQQTTQHKRFDARRDLEDLREPGQGRRKQVVDSITVVPKVLVMMMMIVCICVL